MRLIKVIFSRMPENDSYNQPDVRITQVFDNNGEEVKLISYLLGRSAYHFKYNFPNVEVEYQN